MISGIMILFFSCFLLEHSTALKKKLWAEVDIHQISLLVTLSSAVFAFVVVFLVQDWSFVWTMGSFFLLIFQILAGVLFSELANQAIHHSDRSTSSIMSMMAIPLLLVSDIVLWYGVSLRQIIGVMVLILIVGFSIFRGDFSMKGIKYIIAANLISIATIIAFKYSTTHYASTEMMHLLISCFKCFLFVIIVSKAKGLQGIKDILQPKYLWFASLYGIAGVMSAMVYKYMIASMVIAFKRFFMMIFGVLAGKFFFSEKNVVRKLSISVLVGVGLFVMNFDLLSSIYANTFHKQESLHAAAEVFPTDRMLDFEGDLCREEDKVWAVGLIHS